MSALYFCTPENNTCPKRETCKRFMEVDGNNHATLFKVACTENNDYVLYIKYEEEEKKINESSGNA